VALLCYDAEAGAEVAAMVLPRDFDPVYREIAEQAIDYRHRHAQAPGEHTPDLFDAAAERAESKAPMFARLLDSIERTREDLNPKYVVQRAAAFVRYQRVKSGLEKALRSLTSDDEAGLENAEAALHDALKASVGTFDAGLHFIDDLEATLRFLTDPEEAYPTGIPELDRVSAGPTPGRFGLFAAPSGKGKSWWLIQLTAAALKRGLSVLYVSLELSESELSQRLIQRLLSVTKRDIPEGVTYERFLETPDPEDRGSRRKTMRMKPRPALADPKTEALVRRKLKALEGRGRIILKSFPNGSLSVDQLDSFLTVLEERERFIPHLLLIDYVDIMHRRSGVDRWEALVENAEGVRAIAQRRHIAVNSVTQVKHAALRAKRVEAADTAGATGKIETADTLITMSQTEEEARAKLARLYLAKHRTDADGLQVLIAQAYEVGQFARHSSGVGAAYGADDDEPKKGQPKVPRRLKG